MKKFLCCSVLLLFLCLVLLALTACEESKTPETTTGNTPATTDVEPVQTDNSGQNKPVAHTVTFDTQNGTEVPAQTVEDGKKAQKPADPQKTGYTFGGWTCAGEDWSFIGYVVTEDMTLTAQWTPNTYAVSFDAAGGNTLAPLTVTYDAAYSLPMATRAGYTFAGWFDGETKVENGIWQTVSDKMLTARWAINTYTVSYVLNGGTNAESNPATYTVEDTITLTAPTRDHYTFAGWSDNGAIAIGSTGNRTFAAFWTPISYPISYELNGGTASNKSAYTIETATFSLNAPIRKGYTFLGWTWDGQTEPQTSVTIPLGTTGERTYTANWEIETYFITYNLNEGINSENNPATYTVEDTITLAAPVKPYYVFVGWYSDTGEKISDLSKIKVLADLSLTARWEFPLSIDNSGNIKSVNFNGSDIEYTIPSEWNGIAINSISSSAFSNCGELKSIVIPDSITKIGSGAFRRCRNLTTVTIGRGVISIGSEAFCECSSLASITVVEGNPVYHSSGNCLIETNCKTLVQGCNSSVIPSDGSVTRIGDDAFEGCELVSIIIPASVTSIGTDAFRFCEKLTEIGIPDSITTIGTYAFATCRKLQLITFSGTIEQWNSIQKSYDWDIQTNAITIRCTDGNA